MQMPIFIKCPHADEAGVDWKRDRYFVAPLSATHMLLLCPTCRNAAFGAMMTDSIQAGITTAFTVDNTLLASLMGEGSQ